MRLLELFFRMSPRALILAVLFGVVSGAAAAGMVSRINVALMGVSSPSLVWAFAALCVLRLVASLVAQFQLHCLSQNTMFDLRMKLSASILATPQRKLEELGPAKLLAVLTEDVLLLTQGTFTLAITITHVSVLMACVVYLGSLSLPTLAAVFLVIGLGGGVHRLFSRRAWSLIREARDDEDAMYGGFRGIIEGAKELKLHPARSKAFFAEALDAPADAYRRKHIRGGLLLLVGVNWMSILIYVLIGLLLFVWPSFQVLAPGVLASYVLTILYMQISIETVMANISFLGRADVAIEKLESLGLTLADGTEAPLGAAASSDWNRLELKAVTHVYQHEGDDGDFILGPIDLELRPREIVFIVGGNGSGKSTLGKILTGLYTPNSGEVLLDGQVVDDAGREAYRQLFSAVFSDWYLFERLFGVERADADAQRYLEELRLSKKVSIEDGKFSTTALSQGQRKRLMLLTAYMENRPIYFFDEWASDQDPAFKEVFYTQILEKLKERGKGVVVISHDERYFSVADRIVRVEDGRLL